MSAEVSPWWPYPEPEAHPFTSVFGGHVVLMGYSVKETTGTASAELDLYDGTAATGGNFLPIPLGSGQGTEDWFGPQGIHFRNGLFPNVASGSIAGQVWVAQPYGSRYPHG